MFIPLVTAWIEQESHCLRLWVEGSKITPLGAVAVQATETQIIFAGSSPMLFRNNVIQFKGKQLTFLGYQTVFAAVFCAGQHCAPQCFGDISHLCVAASRSLSTFIARALINVKK